MINFSPRPELLLDNLPQFHLVPLLLVHQAEIITNKPVLKCIQTDCEM